MSLFKKAICNLKQLKKKFDVIPIFEVLIIITEIESGGKIYYGQLLRVYYMFYHRLRGIYGFDGYH